MKLDLPARSLLAAALVVCFANVHAASQPPVAAENGMVVTAQHLATRVGVDVLKDGGNAVDAAVAVGYALAVVYPAAGNLGGGGFMTIQLADGRFYLYYDACRGDSPPCPRWASAPASLSSIAR